MARRVSKRPHIISDYLGELIVNGGVLWTRAGLYASMVNEGHEPRLADATAFCYAKTHPGTAQEIFERGACVNLVPNQYPEGWFD